MVDKHGKVVVPGGGEAARSRARLLALQILRTTIADEPVMLSAEDLVIAVSGLQELAGDLFAKWWGVIDASETTAMKWLDHEIRVEEGRAR